MKPEGSVPYLQKSTMQLDPEAIKSNCLHPRTLFI
jgi:hypothetical protein